METRVRPFDNNDSQALSRVTETPHRSILLAILAIAAASSSAMIIMVTRGRFEQLIAEFEIPASMVTSFALGPVLPAILALTAALTIAKECLERFKPIANVWNGSVVFVSIACLSIYAMGIFNPLMSLITSLS
jgi:hypothetical protein